MHTLRMRPNSLWSVLPISFHELFSVKSSKSNILRYFWANLGYANWSQRGFNFWFATHKGLIIPEQNFRVLDFSSGLDFYLETVGVKCILLHTNVLNDVTAAPFLVFFSAASHKKYIETGAAVMSLRMFVTTLITSWSDGLHLRKSHFNFGGKFEFRS